MAQNATIKGQKSFLKKFLGNHIIFWLKLLLLYWNPREEFFYFRGNSFQIRGEIFTPVNSTFNEKIDIVFLEI